MNGGRAPFLRGAIMEALQAHGALSPAELAEHVGCSPQSANGALARLRDAGLAERTQHGKWAAITAPTVGRVRPVRRVRLGSVGREAAMKLEDITPWNYHLYRGADPRVLALAERLREIERKEPQLHVATMRQWRECERSGARSMAPPVQSRDEPTNVRANWPERTEPPSAQERAWDRANEETGWEPAEGWEP